MRSVVEGICIRCICRGRRVRRQDRCRGAPERRGVLAGWPEDRVVIARKLDNRRHRRAGTSRLGDGGRTAWAQRAWGDDAPSLNRYLAIPDQDPVRIVINEQYTILTRRDRLRGPVIGRYGDGGPRPRVGAVPIP